MLGRDVADSQAAAETAGGNGTEGDVHDLSVSETEKGNRADAFQNDEDNDPPQHLI